MLAIGPEFAKLETNQTEDTEHAARPGQTIKNPSNRTSKRSNLVGKKHTLFNGLC